MKIHELRREPMTETMTETMQDPVMRPTIVRRVVPGALQTMERRAEGERALCVFWSVEDAQRAMREAGFGPEEGWKAIERDHEQLRLVMDALATTSGPRLIYLEPTPGARDLCGIFEADTFIGMLEESERD
jgi:hypothetical protein